MQYLSLLGGNLLKCYTNTYHAMGCPSSCTPSSSKTEGPAELHWTVALAKDTSLMLLALGFHVNPMPCLLISGPM